MLQLERFIKKKNTFLTCKNLIGRLISKADLITPIFSLSSDNISSIVNMFTPIMFRVCFSSSSRCLFNSISLSFRNWCSFSNWAEIWTDRDLDFSFRKKRYLLDLFFRIVLFSSIEPVNNFNCPLYKCFSCWKEIKSKNSSHWVQHLTLDCVTLCHLPLFSELLPPALQSNQSVCLLCQGQFPEPHMSSSKKFIRQQFKIMLLNITCSFFN